MGVLTDLWSGLPKEVKILFGISIFLLVGSTLLQAMVFAWNLFVVNAMNLVNGCLTGASEACIPQQDGIYILGINFADYWTIVILIVLLPIALFAIKWYGFAFGQMHQD